MAAYHKQLEVKPGHEAASANLAHILQEQGNFDEAIGLLCDSIQELPKSALLRNSLAWLLYEQGPDLGEAEEFARRAVELKPDDPNSSHTLACILARRSNWPGALEQALAFLGTGSEDFFERNWPHILTFFAEVVAPDALGVLQYQGVDPDDLAILGERGAAAVAGVDRRVGLDEARVSLAAVARKDARGYRVAQARGAADGVEPGTLGEVVVRVELEVGATLGGQLEQGQVVVGGEFGVLQVESRIIDQTDMEAFRAGIELELLQSLRHSWPRVAYLGIVPPVASVRPLAPGSQKGIYC